MKAAVAALATLVVLSGTASAQSVSVAFEDGTVTLSARNAPLRAILAEWARVGGSTFVNADRVTGAPLTLELEGVSEREALRILLRNVSGYIAAARQARSPGASSLDRILIVPTSAPVSSAASPPPQNAPPPVIFIPGDPDEDPITDVPPDGFAPTEPNSAPPDVQQQLREAAARAAEAREGADGDADVDPEPASSRPGGRSSRTRNSPFGNVQGSSQPGVITPAPQDDPDDPDR